MHLNEGKRKKDFERIIKIVSKKFEQIIRSKKDEDKIKHGLFNQSYREFMKEAHVLLKDENDQLILCDMFIFTDIIFISNCENPNDHVIEDMSSEYQNNDIKYKILKDSEREIRLIYHLCLCEFTYPDLGFYLINIKFLKHQVS